MYRICSAEQCQVLQGCTYLLRVISYGGSDPEASVPSVWSLDPEGPGVGDGPVGGGPVGGGPVGGGPV
jgi:hypothetical protein